MKKIIYLLTISVLLVAIHTNCKKDVGVCGVKLNKSSLTLVVGETKTLIATVFPENAINKIVFWRSSNFNIATVVDGIITAKDVGQSTISVTTEEGNYTAICVIYVIPKEDCVIINDIKWATRNLAAHGKFVEKQEDYGALFQWGRKGDGHEQRTSPNYPTNDISNETGIVSGTENFDSNGQIVSTHAAYGKFIKGSDHPRDWRNPYDLTLWNSGSENSPKKTANDPCPAGWRTPTQRELASLVESGSEWVSCPVPCRYFGSDTHRLFLPAAGYRHLWNGQIIGMGWYGDYWTSTSDSTHAGYLDFSSSNFFVTRHFHTCGLSVRCVAEN